MYKNLLVPIDGTELADKAMTQSILFAKQLGASITGFVAEPTAPAPAGGRPGARAVEMEAVGHDVETRQHAQDVLGLFETRARRAGVAFTGHHVQAIDVDDAIVDAARELGCDMIVMVTHGRGVLGSLLFGGHTKNVMARSKLPLLVLH